MNIFTAAVTGLTIVIKNIGIGFNAVMIGLKIAIISVIDFIASMITAIINAIVSAIKWVVTQIVNLIYLLFRTYLRIEAGCVLPVQKFAGFMIRLRSGFVILSGLYAVYQYLGITALLVAIAVCVVLVVIGYSQAEKEEEEWNSTFDWVNRVIAKYLKYLIRLSIMTSSVYLLFHSTILTTPGLNNKIFSNVRTMPILYEFRPKEIQAQRQNTAVRSAVAAASGGIRGGSGSGVISPTVLHQYGSLLNGKISSHWKVPELVKTKPDLKTQVVLTVRKNGSIENMKIERKSGDALFDQSVLRALQNAEPLPSFPALISQPALEVELNFTPKGLTL